MDNQDRRFYDDMDINQLNTPLEQHIIDPQNVEGSVPCTEIGPVYSCAASTVISIPDTNLSSSSAITHSSPTTATQAASKRRKLERFNSAEAFADFIKGPGRT